MNLDRLKEAEETFLQRYPGGFDNPEISAIRRKRHNVDRMIAFTQEAFSKENFNQPGRIVEDVKKVVSRSSVISVFEKAKFRDFLFFISPDETKFLAKGLEALLHGKEETGFEEVLKLFEVHKLSKWPLMTICQTYYHPLQDVLVKPNTVKSIISYFELTHLHYHPTPTWKFYEAYRSTIHEMKSKVDTSLSPVNAAFSWFLLLSTRGGYLL